MTTAVPRRNPYGEAVIRPTLVGINRSTRPSWDSMIWWTTSGRPTGARQLPRLDRGTSWRSRRPSAYRCARGVDRRRSEVYESPSSLGYTT